MFPGVPLLNLYGATECASNATEYDTTLLPEDSRRVPIGSNARFVERFTPTADGSRLEYTLDVTDPESLTAPAQFRRTWVWRPGEQVLPFNCRQ